jgi:hypothetical protein
MRNGVFCAVRAANYKWESSQVAEKLLDSQRLSFVELVGWTVSS